MPKIVSKAHEQTARTLRSWIAAYESNRDLLTMGAYAKSTNKALDACPVGALLRKRVGFDVPVGRRRYDHEPIGTDMEAPREERR